MLKWPVGDLPGLRSEANGKATLNVSFSLMASRGRLVRLQQERVVNRGPVWSSIDNEAGYALGGGATL